MGTELTCIIFVFYSLLGQSWYALGRGGVINVTRPDPQDPASPSRDYSPHIAHSFVTVFQFRVVARIPRTLSTVIFASFDRPYPSGQCR